MIVTVESYSDKTFDLFCVDETGEQVVVDPFIVAVLCDSSEHIEQTAISFVGKSFEFNGNCKSTSCKSLGYPIIYFPSTFVEVSRV